MTESAMASDAFGDRLRSRRKALGMSQQVLASRLGVSLATIRRWEANENSPQPGHFESLAEFLEIRREALAALVAGNVVQLDGWGTQTVDAPNPPSLGEPERVGVAARSPDLSALDKLWDDMQARLREGPSFSVVDRIVLRNLALYRGASWDDRS